jgi:hypothetical protein
MSPGEWDSAGHADFMVNRAPSEGGGTVPATIYVMNDAANLYLGLKVMNATIGRSDLVFQFGNAFQEGSDYLRVDRTGAFLDMFTHQVAPNTWDGVPDTDYAGTSDGNEWEANASGYSFYELSHPLNDADDAHDFSLTVLTRASFDIRFTHCTTSCAAVSRFPGRGSSSQADIVIVSGSHVPPDTQLTAGPAERSVVRGLTATFEFSGSDDVLDSSQLTFECKTDDDAWGACTSPYQNPVGNGRHMFSVRAIDDMLNVDQTPAERTWIVDRTAPSKPVVRGRRSVRAGKLVVLRFSATDEFTPASRIRFRCGVDAAGIRPCPAVFRAKLRPGRHVVRVNAFDRVGNRSATSRFRVRVQRARR